MPRRTPRLLDDDEITRQLLGLAGWTPSEGRLSASYVADSFATAVRLIDEVAAEAEVMDHHPDVDLRWCTVRLLVWTHSAGGITQLDIELAHRAQEWARRLGAAPVVAGEAAGP